MTAVRYYFDEHVRSGVLVYLRAHQIDILTAQEANRAGQRIPDADQLTYAAIQDRVLASSDKHFLNPRVVPQLMSGEHAGIIRLTANASIGDQARYLRYIAETETMESMAGQIRYYEPVPRGIFDDD